jgi:hypothetical protein
MKHKGKKISKQRFTQLQIAKSRNQLAKLNIGDKIPVLHPDFSFLLKEQGYIDVRGTVLKQMGELVGR